MFIIERNGKKHLLPYDITDIINSDKKTDWKLVEMFDEGGVLCGRHPLRVYYQEPSHADKDDRYYFNKKLQKWLPRKTFLRSGNLYINKVSFYDYHEKVQKLLEIPSEERMARARAARKPPMTPEEKKEKQKENTKKYLQKEKEKVKDYKDNYIRYLDRIALQPNVADNLRKIIRNEAKIFLEFEYKEKKNKLIELLDKQMEEEVKQFLTTVDENGKSKSAILIDSLFRAAIDPDKPNMKAAEILMDRAFGKPTVKQENKTQLESKSINITMYGEKDRLKQALDRKPTILNVDNIDKETNIIDMSVDNE